MRHSAVETTAAAYIAWSAVGTAIAIAEDEPAAFAGWNLSTGNVARDFLVGAGTGLSAPLSLLLGLAAAIFSTRAQGRFGRFALRLVSVMGLCFVVGQAGEPITWRTLSPRTAPFRVALVLGNIAIPIALSAAAFSALRTGPEGSNP